MSQKTPPSTISPSVVKPALSASHMSEPASSIQRLNTYTLMWALCGMPARHQSDGIQVALFKRKMKEIERKRFY